MFGAEEDVGSSAGIPESARTSCGMIGGSCVPIDIC